MTSLLINANALHIPLDKCLLMPIMYIHSKNNITQEYIGEDMTKEMVPYEVLIRDALAGETPKERYENLVLMKTILRQAEKRIAELEAELAELNDKAVFIQFENEDELPSGIKDDVYSAMFECSHVDGVRLFPYIEENGQKYFLVMLREKEKPDENILP